MKPTNSTALQSLLDAAQATAQNNSHSAKNDLRALVKLAARCDTLLHTDTQAWQQSTLALIAARVPKSHKQLSALFNFPDIKTFKRQIRTCSDCTFVAVLTRIENACNLADAVRLQTLVKRWRGKTLGFLEE